MNVVLNALGLATITLSESKIDIASRWVNREYNLMFTVSSNKDQKTEIRFHVRFPSVSMNPETMFGVRP